jgi:NitT/TauT family transport system substrate-binding protein
MNLRTHRNVFFVSIVAIVLLVGCGPQQAATPTLLPPTNLSIQLGWTYDYSLAGFYSAEKNNHFATQNLKVYLEEGGFANGKYIDPIDEVAKGTVNFGLTSASSLIMARSQGTPIVGIMAVLQHSPNAVISLADKKLARPQDLVGHKVAVADGGAQQEFLALLKTQNIDPKSVNIISRTDFGIDSLLKGDVDALVGWITNEGVLVKEAGKEPNFMLMSDYGVETYTSMLFTTEDMVKNRPQDVQRFVQAAVQGLQDEVANPDQAIDYTLQYGKDLQRTPQLTRLQSTIPLIHPAESKIGLMDSSVWDITQKMLLDESILNKPIDITKAYDLTFVDKIYAK